MRIEPEVSWIDPETQEIRRGQWWAKAMGSNCVWAVPYVQKDGEIAVRVRREKVSSVGHIVETWRGEEKHV